MPFAPSRLRANTEKLYQKVQQLADDDSHSEKTKEDIRDFIISVEVEFKISSSTDIDTENISPREGIPERKLEKLLNKYEGTEIEKSLKEVEALMSRVRLHAEPNGCF